MISHLYVILQEKGHTTAAATFKKQKNKKNKQREAHFVKLLRGSFAVSS